MELDVASAFNNGKDLQRKQDLLDRVKYKIHVFPVYIKSLTLIGQDMYSLYV